MILQSHSSWQHCHNSEKNHYFLKIAPIFKRYLTFFFPNVKLNIKISFITLHKVCQKSHRMSNCVSAHFYAFITYVVVPSFVLDSFYHVTRKIETEVKYQSFFIISPPTILRICKIVPHIPVQLTPGDGTHHQL